MIEGVANYFPHALPNLPLGRPLSPEIHSQIKITNAGDAYRLCISINPVRNHRSNLFKKTNARNMVDLVKRTTLPQVGKLTATDPACAPDPATPSPALG